MQFNPRPVIFIQRRMLFLLIILLTCLDIPAQCTTARVSQTSSGPALYVNSERVAPTFIQVGIDSGYSPLSRQTVISEVAMAAANGVNLVNLTIWGMPWWQSGETPDFSTTDDSSWMDAVLSANPNALVVLRFPVTSVWQWWADAHPNDMNRFNDGTQGLGQASMHSPQWKTDAASNIQAFVNYMEGKYADHIIGYQVCGQPSAEWYYEGTWDSRYSGYEPIALDAFKSWLIAKYTTYAALRIAWNDPNVTWDTVTVPSVSERQSASTVFRNPATQMKVIDFDQFRNDGMADAVSAMCKAIKDVVPNKLALAFYGYHFEFSGSAKSGHMSLARLLQSPYVDGLSAPFSYTERGPGQASYIMQPCDSIQLSGKLWLTEDDTRTFLDNTDHVGQCADARETYGVWTRTFAGVLTRGGGLWWMDSNGQGALNDSGLWHYAGGLSSSYKTNEPDFTPYHPDIAVIVDDTSTYYSPTPGGVLPPTACMSFRHELYRIGASIGYYLLDDLIAGRVPETKMYIFWDTFRLDDSQIAAIRAQACKNGHTLIWMYAPGVIRNNVMSSPWSTYVGDVTGITVAETPYGDGNMSFSWPSGSSYTFYAGHGHLNKTLRVSDAGATTIATYQNGGQVAVASKYIPSLNYTSVYCGALQLPSRILRDLASQAGVWIYNSQNEITAAGNGYVSFQASSDGTKTLTMPSSCTLFNPMTGENYQESGTFNFNMRASDTKLFRINNMMKIGASSVLDGCPLSNLVDDNASTVWSSVGHPNAAGAEWSGIDIESIQGLAGLRITPCTGGAYFPVDFRLQSSNDGVAWADIAGQSYASYANPGSAPINFLFSMPVEARYFRLYATMLSNNGGGSYYLRLAEMGAIPARGPSWEFDFDGFTENWYAQHDISGLTASGGSLSGDVIGGDPYLVTEDYPKINADVMRYVHVRMKTNTGTAAGFYWKSDAAPYHSADRAVVFPTTADGHYHDYTVDMSSNPNWTGIVYGLRFDVVGDASTGHFSVDFIRTLPVAPWPHWEFHYYGDTDGWSVGNGVANMASADGLLTGDITGSDPYLLGPTHPLIDTSVRKCCYIRMRVSSGATARLGWVVQNGASYGHQFPVIADGQYHSYFLDLSADPGWVGTVSTPRLDPSEEATTGNFGIDFVRLGSWSLTPPTGSVVINSGADYAASATVNLALAAADVFGGAVSDMRLSSDGVNWYASWEPFAASKTWTLPAGQGLKGVYVQFRDGFGGISSTCYDSIYLDTAAPTGSVVINSGASYSNSSTVNLALSATDTGSGVADMRFMNGGEADWTAWEPYQTSRPWDLKPGDGSRSVLVQFRDLAGSASAARSASIYVDSASPTAPGTPTDSGAYTTNTSVAFNWTAGSDTGSGVSGYNCQIGTAPDGNDAFDSDVGAALSKTLMGSYGDHYFCRVQTRDRAGNVSAWSNASDGISVVEQDCMDIGSAKIATGSRSVGLASKVVTAIFGGDFYVEEPGRASGILVKPVAGIPVGLVVGNPVDVGGALNLTDNDELWIDAVVQVKSGTLTILPLGLSNLALGGGDWHYIASPPVGQRGITGALGTNNIGLLVRTWGKVFPNDASSFKIDDGSAVDVTVVVPSGVAVPDPGTYVAVTGISSCCKVGSDLRRVLLVRGSDDISHYP